MPAEKPPDEGWVGTPAATVGGYIARNRRVREREREQRVCTPAPVPAAQSAIYGVWAGVTPSRPSLTRRKAGAG